MANDIKKDVLDLGFNVSNHVLEIMDNLTGEVPEEIRSKISKQLLMIQSETQELMMKVVLGEDEKEIKLM